jgi:hypothetical protein
MSGTRIKPHLLVVAVAASGSVLLDTPAVVAANREATRGRGCFDQANGRQPPGRWKTVIGTRPPTCRYNSRVPAARQWRSLNRTTPSPADPAEHDSIAMTGTIPNTIPYPGFCSTTEDQK